MYDRRLHRGIVDTRVWSVGPGKRGYGDAVQGCSISPCLPVHTRFQQDMRVVVVSLTGDQADDERRFLVPQVKYALPLSEALIEREIEGSSGEEEFE